MEKIYTCLIGLILSVFSSGCEDAEIKPKNYPYVLMKNVKVHEDRIILTAEVISLGNAPILSHGFMLEQQTSNTPTKIPAEGISNPLKKGTFTFEMDTTFIEGETYSVQPYIQSEIYLVYGNKVSFKRE